MQKIAPFIFPLVAFVIVLLLLFRWYSLQNSRSGQITDEGQVIELNDLLKSQNGTPSATPNLGGKQLGQASDYKTQELQPFHNEKTGVTADATGNIRYEITNNQVALTVFVQLMQHDSGVYQVWWQKGDTLTKAFVLEPGKGGLMGSATISQDQLPLEVVVSHEHQNDTKLEEILLRGTLK